MPKLKKRQNQQGNPKSSKGGISEAAAIGGAMAGGAIGSTVAAFITTGELKKRLVKAVPSLSKQKKKKTK